jgi:hypothetical protein
VTDGPGAGIGSFHVHRGHAFAGLRIEEQDGRLVVVADCACGEMLDVADAVFRTCPACAGAGEECARCGSTGRIVDHAALRWRMPPSVEEP